MTYSDLFYYLFFPTPNLIYVKQCVRKPHLPRGKMFANLPKSYNYYIRARQKNNKHTARILHSVTTAKKTREMYSKQRSPSFQTNQLCQTGNYRTVLINIKPRTRVKIFVENSKNYKKIFVNY